MTTTETLIERCEARFDDTGNAIVSEAQWLEYLQDAYDEGNGWSPFWPWLETRVTNASIAAGANTWTPTDTTNLRVLSILNVTDNYPLWPSEGRGDLRYAFPDITEQGSPQVYRVFNNTLEVYPITDHAITLYVEHMSYPAALANSATTNVWPAQYHRVLIDGALARAYEDDGNPEAAELHRGRFLDGLAKMEETTLSGQRQESYPAVVDDWF